jgi:hypothetical protein
MGASTQVLLVARGGAVSLREAIAFSEQGPTSTSRFYADFDASLAARYLQMAALGRKPEGSSFEDHGRGRRSRSFVARVPRVNGMRTRSSRESIQ